MRALVLDASAATALVLEGQRTANADALLDDWDRFSVGTPYVFLFEMHGLLLKRERRERWKGQPERALEFLAELEIAVAEAPGRDELRDVLELARRLSIGFYDAFYIQLAVETGAMLATRDGVMVDVARRQGLEVLDVRA